MSRQPLNIVILGGSFGGLSVAHTFLDRYIHQLSTFEGAPTYRVVLISPSTHLYWNICAPRAIVSSDLIPTEDAFVPIEPAFSRYPFSEFTFMQGSARNIDTSARQVTVEIVSNDLNRRHSAGLKSPMSPKSPVSPTSARSPTTPKTPKTPTSFITKNTDYRSNTANRDSNIQFVPYHALIIATGSTAVDNLYSLHGTHEDTMADIKRFHARLEKAHSVLIVGGGPSGCETAGQIATHFNQRNKWKTWIDPKAKPQKHVRESNEKDQQVSDSGDSPTMPEVEATPAGPNGLARIPKTITLLSGADRLLPKLPPSVGKQAAKRLKKQGVHIVHNLRQVGSTLNDDGSSNCMLNNDMTITSDIMIAATGVYPNTQFCPSQLLDEYQYVNADPETLRVYGSGAGDRVYAIGDCASYSKNYILDVYEAIPAMTKNLYNDLLAHEYILQTKISIPASRGSSFDNPDADRRSPSPTVPLIVGPRLSFPAPQTAGIPSSRARATNRETSIFQNYRSGGSVSTNGQSSLDASGIGEEEEIPNDNPLTRRPTSQTVSTRALHPHNPRIALLTHAEARAKIDALEDMKYVQNPSESQLMPLTRWGGVGVIYNYKLPSFFVHLFKGRTYKIKRATTVVGRGRNPYDSPFDGTK